jgi:hypothetical protein
VSSSDTPAYGWISTLIAPSSFFWNVS